MNALLDLWHGEHANFARLLNLLDEQLLTITSGDQPDYRLMEDVVRYLKEYGDAVHHPREDYAFARLAHRDSATRALVNRRLQEHRVIDIAGRELLDRLREIDVDSMMSRAALEGAIATYLVYYRHHLVKEEGEVLPRIARLFDARDWADTVAAVQADGDPLADPHEAARFAALRKRLTS